MQNGKCAWIIVHCANWGQNKASTKMSQELCQNQSYSA